MNKAPIGPGKDRPAQSATQRLEQLIAIGIALMSERERHFANAEAGTLFLRDSNLLRFAVAQNDALVKRMGESEMRRQLAAEPLKLSPPSLAGHVALTGRLINLPDAYCVADGQPYAFNGRMDAILGYHTRSVLVVPLQEPKSEISLMQALAPQAAVATQNARLEDLSFKDPLTGVYNRRYFGVRIEEEAKRHARFAEPVSLVLLDLDRFKHINDQLGHRAGDDTLREAAQLIVTNSRSFSIVTRYGGDEFAVLLVNTPKAGALKYAQRIKDVIERHRFAHGPLTVSVGIAALPEDVTVSDDLLPAAARALYLAKRLGRNLIEVA